MVIEKIKKLIGSKVDVDKIQQENKKLSIQKKTLMDKLDTAESKY